MANAPKDVIIKENVRIPSILKKFIEDGMTDLYLTPMIPARETLRAAVQKQGVTYYDTNVSMKFYNPPKTNATGSVTVTLGNQVFQISANDLRFVNRPNYSNLSNQYRNWMNTMERISCKGPYIDFLLSSVTNNANRRSIATHMVLVGVSAVYMNWAGLKESEHQFIRTFWSGTIAASIRHGVKARLSGVTTSNDPYKIPWHRNSNYNVSTGEKGFLTTGLYIHRPSYVMANSGGISFAKGSKEARIYPKPGTVVTFFDQQVIHKVIPVRLDQTRANARNNYTRQLGFIQRTAVFMAWFTTPAHLSTASGLNYNRFKKAGIRVPFRDLKELYKILITYFNYITRKKNQYLRGHPNISNYNSLFRNAPNNFIQGIYRGINASANDVAAFNKLRILSGGGVEGRPETVANLVLYKMIENPGNNAPRRRLQDLYNVYKNLKASFGNVVTNRGPKKPFARRGGRVTNASFVRLN